MAYQWEADEKALVCVYNKPKEPVHGSDLLGIDLTLLSLGILCYTLEKLADIKNYGHCSEKGANGHLVGFLLRLTASS